MKGGDQLMHWIKVGVMLIVVILIISTTTSCGTTPTTPRLTVPEKPDFPKFTDDELDQLKACAKGVTYCTVSRSIILKFDEKVLLYRGYAREAIRVIEENNRHAN